MKGWIGGALLWLVVMTIVALVAGCSSAGTRSLPEESVDSVQPDPADVVPDAVGAPGVSGVGAAPEGLLPPTAQRAPERGLPEVAGTRVYKVRLVGDHVLGAKGLFVNVRSLRAWADGAEVPVLLENGSVDLSHEGDAALIGRVRVPTATTAVRFRLELDDYGAYVPADKSKAGGVDLHESPIEWTSQTEWMKDRGHTVVHLDVGKSLMRMNDGWRFLPQLIVLH